MKFSDILQDIELGNVPQPQIVAYIIFFEDASYLSIKECTYTANKRRQKPLTSTFSFVAVSTAIPVNAYIVIGT